MHIRALLINIASALLFCTVLAGQVSTLQITQGTAGAGRLHSTITTLGDVGAAFHMGQSNARGVSSTMPGSNLPAAMQDSADVLREYVWTFAGGGVRRKSYPVNVSPIKRAADSLLTGAKQPYQLVLPPINPRVFLADWNRGGTALVPYPSSGFFTATTASAYNMDDWMSSIVALPNFKKYASFVVWSQGEDEMATGGATALAYAENWVQFASDFRSMFGYRIPMFIIKMHDFPGAGDYSTMIAEQTTMAQQAGNCYLIDPSGLGASSVHYTYDEHVILTQRVATAIASYYNRPQLIKI